MPDPPDLIAQRIEDWRRRLIDLSYRNRLIRYRPTVASTLEIESPDVSVLLTDIGSAAPWRFYFPPELDESELAVDDAAEFVDETVLRRIATESRLPRADEIVLREQSPRRINRTLENLARKSNAEYEDKALRILYIAAGFLDWFDTARNEELSSPLVLVPVQLRRDSARDPYKLFFVDDEETVVNPSLTEKLRRDLGREIPLEWAWEDKPVEVELDEIEGAVAGTGWSVRRDAVIGLFSFQKFVMYRDLLDNEGQIAAHPMVRSLAERKLAPELDEESIEVPDVSELDDVQPPASDVLILDSDSSQRQAIEAAKRGQSFVMHGPPGTGKSQTIANIIADAIGAGRRVLFVSEKAAALDVVHRRLKAKELDEFCLMLHGEHAARREVVEALHRSLTSELVPRRGMGSSEFERLGDLRDVLNNSAELVHLPMPVLGDRSLRDVLGTLAQLHAAPSIPKAPSPTDATGSEVRSEHQQLNEVFERIAERWSVSREHFVWREYAGERFSSELRGEVLVIVGAAREAIRRVADLSGDAARLLGWSLPINARAVDHLLELGAHLERAPGLGRDWLDADLDELVEVADECESTFEVRWQTDKAFAAAYQGRTLAELPADLENLFDERLSSMSQALGRTNAWERDLIRDLPELRAFLTSAVPLVDQVSTTALEAAGRFGQPDREVTLERAEEVATLATLAFTGERRPEADWLVAAGLARAHEAIADSRDTLARYQEEERRLFEEYEPGALELDSDGLHTRFTTIHTSAFSKLRGAYRRDARAVKAVRKDGKVPQSIAQDLSDLVELQRLGAELDGRSERHARAFGSYYEGRHTSVDDVETALAVADEVSRLRAPDSDLDALARVICVGSEPDARTAQVADQLRAGITELMAGLEKLQHFVGRDGLLSASEPLTALRGDAQLARDELDEFARLFELIALNSRQPLRSLVELRERAALVTLALEARALIVARAGLWGRDLAPYYDGLETSWSQLKAALGWLRDFRSLTASSIPSPLRDLLLADERRWPDFEGVRRARQLFTEKLEVLLNLFEAARADARRQASGSEAFDELDSWCQRLSDHVDDLFDWVELKSWRSRAVERGWGDFIAELVTHEVEAEFVVASFARAYWSRRLESLFEEEPGLADRGPTYERWIEEFQQLDRRLIRTAPDRLIATRNRGRTAHVVVSGSEVALLRREAVKRTRHRPVRKLLAEIPSLLSDLKPCLMMSPLTVSHFLAPTHVFDLVIFDEASQVPPQDAINCVYRGRQVIVAGDGRQLPPTPFFQVAELEDAWSDEVEETTEDMESILDSCEALLPEHSLRWHYRSRHKHLIAFSNQHVYDDSLLTFPSADHFSKRKGVRFTYVPDGLYERGRSSTNRVEARVVAERVISHLREGMGSVGVITFNLAQANVVSEELDRLRIEHPDLEPHFSGDRLDAVFVKHLESVQGDERDLIVFSIGYGRDADGKFTMNFGPLNKEGGYRRLNVAVTRARDLVEVVSSVHAADFTLSDTAARGARLLREYIRYAEMQGAVLDGPLVDVATAEYGSPLESEIAEVVRDIGYEPVPQVGAGSFRIDVGIRDRGQSDRYLLGVVTDSLFYSQTPTARDRDRLREEVLTGILGWRLHRIWALDWVRNRQSEIERLEEGLKAAIGDQPTVKKKRTTEVDVVRKRTEVEVTELDDALDATRLPWVREYELVALPWQTSFYEFHESVNRAAQKELLGRLLEVEAPVHIDYAIRRLAEAWGLQRVRDRARRAGLQIISAATRSGVAEKRGKFLWRPGQTLEVVRCPKWGDPRTERSIQEIPPEEIDLAMIKLIEASGGTMGDHVYSDVAKVLGFERVGPNIRAALNMRVKAMQRAAATDG
jgi:hypothetical protein